MITPNSLNQITPPGANGVSADIDPSRFICDWNDAQGEPGSSRDSVELADESFRDALQASYVVKNPSIETKITLLHIMDRLGINAVSLGFLAAGSHIVADATELAKEIVTSKLQIRPFCLARTLSKDIDPIADLSQRIGIPIEVETFLGSSPVRQVLQDWSAEALCSWTRGAVTHAVRHQLPAFFITEDTTRSNHEVLESLWATAIDSGAARIGIADTVGYSNLRGTREIVTHLSRFIIKRQANVTIDWHGHNDRGLGLANALVAMEAGASRIHATAMGVGERAGNTSMDQLLANLVVDGVLVRDMTSLPEYVRTFSNACGIPIPANYPISGEGVFETQAGVHADPIVKAFKKGLKALGQVVYAFVSPGIFGRQLSVKVGPHSGESNVELWAILNEIDPVTIPIDRVLAKAKSLNQVLTDHQIRELCNGQVPAVKNSNEGERKNDY